MTTTTENPAAAKIRVSFRAHLHANKSIEGAAMDTAHAYAMGIVHGLTYPELDEGQQMVWRVARYFALKECAAAVAEAAAWIDGKADALT